MKMIIVIMMKVINNKNDNNNNNERTIIGIIIRMRVIIDDNYNNERVRLYTTTPSPSKGKSNAPSGASHSQQQDGVPPFLELNKTSFGNRRTITPASHPSWRACN